MKKYAYVYWIHRENRKLQDIYESINVKYYMCHKFLQLNDDIYNIKTIMSRYYDL